MTRFWRGIFLCEFRMKTFTSVEKLAALITGDEEYFNQLMEVADAISP